jgi:RNase H-fold protein (predicted Holliday junction resolvase)
MEDKKYLLALDVSTSCIGIALFEDLGTKVN